MLDFARSDPGRHVVSSILVGNVRGMNSVPDATIFPARHHLTDSPEQFKEALCRIQDELHSRAAELREKSKHVEAN